MQNNNGGAADLRVVDVEGQFRGVIWLAQDVGQQTQGTPGGQLVGGTQPHPSAIHGCNGHQHQQIRIDR